ncbi:MAG: M23 family metallopeptidase [Alphaproteobacteria bacterium]|nr:M23 family metallopeptidase [Alphaproteobacteria bacterium]
MSIRNKLRDIRHRSRIIRLSTYRKMGVGHLHKQIDISLLMLVLICLISLPFAIRLHYAEKVISTEDPFVIDEIEGSEDNIIPSTAIEQVHEDLGDAPVEAPQYVSLDELEKRAQLGEIDVTMRTMEKGDTLLGLLAERKVPAAQRVEVVEALELLLDLKSLRPGLTFLFFHDKDDKLLGLSLTPRANETIAVVRELDDSWTPISHTGRVETKQELVQVEIERTFSGSAKKAGLPSGVINQIMGALDGEIDFASDFKSGDTVDVIIESKVTQGGLEIGSKQVLYIGVKAGKKEIHRYAYNNAFYDARGRTAAKMLLKRPVKAKARLSSAFGKRRHPILGYEIFHKGVDLAVPKNTPVVAAADGVIEQIGRKGSYGKYIRIRHAAGFETAYAHLNGYRQDLKVKSKVKRGEVIGYVGTTGRSTGPHLHFEVIKNGNVVHPFRDNKIVSSQLSGFELEQFQSWGESVNKDFKLHQVGNVPAVPSAKPF